jgi:hypothetical protein
MNGILSAASHSSNRTLFVFSLAFYWALSWWFINDSRKQGAPWADKYMDMGMYLYVAWIFIIPYYLFRTRGWKAIYIIGLSLGIYFGAYVMGVIFYLIVSLL